MCSKGSLTLGHQGFIYHFLNVSREHQRSGETNWSVLYQAITEMISQCVFWMMELWMNFGLMYIYIFFFKFSLKLFCIFCKFSLLFFWVIKNKIKTVPSSCWVRPPACPRIVSSLNYNYVSFLTDRLQWPFNLKRVFPWGVHFLKDIWKMPTERVTHFLQNP